VVQAEDHPHGGGLAGAIRAEEAGDHAGPAGEAEVIDGEDRAVAFGEIAGLDHRVLSLRSVYCTG
jgi:hypothetical protein